MLEVFSVVVCDDYKDESGAGVFIMREHVRDRCNSYKGAEGKIKPGCTRLKSSSSFNYKNSCYQADI